VQVVGQAALLPPHRYGAQLGLPAEPAATLEQVPSTAAPAATLHASHAAPQALLQQTPSTQLPDEHSPVVLQVLPFDFLVTQAPPLQ
jgi:hypothetical protein